MRREFPSITKLDLIIAQFNKKDLHALGWNADVLFKADRKDAFVAPVMLSTSINRVHPAYAFYIALQLPT